MKRERSRALVLAAGALLGSCAGGVSAGYSAAYVPGEYYGSGEAFRGPVRVLVETGPCRILRVEIIDHDDDEITGGAAMEELAALALEWNSAGLDAVSGATESSEGFLEALEDALAKARVR